MSMDDRLRKLTRRIWAVIRRGVVVSYDERKNPRLMVRGSHDRTPVELFLPYGFSYQPPASGEAVYFSEQGDEDLAYAVGVTGGNARPRTTYAGHVIIWGINGQRIEFKEDGGMDIAAPGGVTINGIDWDTHRHTRVQIGGGTSGGPV